MQQQICISLQSVFPTLHSNGTEHKKAGIFTVCAWRADLLNA